jgi:8-hydroxy-5-deazaflavin:NADPH oxidoreductase
MAARLAFVGIDVVLGSRSMERATEACETIRKRWPDIDLPLTPGTNVDAARTDLVVVATPWDAAASTAASVATELDGKVVISIANALAKIDGEFRPVVPPEGSVALAVQQAVPNARVAAAFHHLPARSLADLSLPVKGDVLLCADDPTAVEATVDLVRRIPDLRPLHAGSLANAAPIEELTAVLLEVNRRYKLRATIRLIGHDGN